MSKYQQTIARIFAGLAVLGALALLLWPADFDGFMELERIERLFAFLGVLLVWILTEVKQSEEIRPEKSHPNDLNISKRFVVFFSNEMQDFLSSQDLGSTFSYSTLSKIMDLHDSWDNLDWEYEDDELSNSFSKFKETFEIFGSRLFRDFEPVGPHDRVRLIIPQNERASDLFTTGTLRKVDELNRMSRNVYEKALSHARLIRRTQAEVFEVG